MTFFRFLRLIAAMGILTVIAVAAIWLCVDRPAAEKTATALAQPAGILWYMLIAAAIVSWKHAERAVAVWSTLTCLAFTVAGSGFVSEAVFRSLERPFYKSRPMEEEPFDVVILLGGGTSDSPAGRRQGNTSGDRAILTAQIYHAGLTSRIICSGNRIPSVDSSKYSPGENSIAVLQSLNVPASVLEQIPGRNTSEELLAIQELLPTEDSRVGLVTSAWHMPRVLKLADRLGVKLIPLPADFRSGPPRKKAPGEIINACIPSAESLNALSAAVKEYLAMAMGR